MTIIRPLILCGGAGTRLWPVSRDTMPKQFAMLLGDRSPFQDTILRTKKFGMGRPAVLINYAHRHIVQQQLADIAAEADIFVEPTRRDSGPAIAAGSLAISRQDPRAMVLVLAADHVISDPAAFFDAVQVGVVGAQHGRIVTFGVVPTHPETAYGYIKTGTQVAPGVSSVAQFAEKPSAERAAIYVNDGMLWNSGNFLFDVSSLIHEYQRFDPKTMAALYAAVDARVNDAGVTAFGAAYEQARSCSIDYAVMEKTDRAAVVPVSCGWSDIGSWDSLWAFGQKDEDGNVVSGEAELLDSKNCFVSSNGPLATVVGLEDVVVVANDDAILVCERTRSGDVKKLVEQLHIKGRSEADVHPKVHRPWGWYQVTDASPGFQVKRIVVNPGGRLSLQKHRYRAEHWVIVGGVATVTVDETVQTVSPNQHVHIPLGAVHRLENHTNAPVTMVEVQSGSYLGEDDIIRIEDVYNRV